MVGRNDGWGKDGWEEGWLRGRMIGRMVSGRMIRRMVGTMVEPDNKGSTLGEAPSPPAPGKGLHYYCVSSILHNFLRFACIFPYVPQFPVIVCDVHHFLQAPVIFRYDLQFSAISCNSPQCSAMLRSFPQGSANAFEMSTYFAISRRVSSNTLRQ